MKQCYSWWSVAGRGVEDKTLLDRTRQIGYTGVELIGRELFDLAIDVGFEIVTHNGHASIDSGLNDPANHDRIVREIDASLELAVKYGIRKLIVFSGNRRPGLNEKEGEEHTAAGLQRIARSAEDANVTLVLELLNSRVDHIGYQCDTSAWGCRVIEAVDSPNVKLLYDIYHAQVMEGDLIRTIEQRGDRFAHYHTAGNPGRHDLDKDQEIAYPAVFRAITATGYSGYIGHEFIPKAEPIAALRAAYGLLESSLRG
jgi:hydroxypyruvate isomerase